MRPKGAGISPEEQREPCPACGGSGQLSQFRGVSRFLLTVAECPECAGLGYLLPSDEGSPEDQASKGKNR